MSVGTNIKRRRYELKMSQQELADAMGYKTRSTIAKIESGENDVSQKKLQKMAGILDTTVEALVSGYASAAEPSEIYFPIGKRKNRNVVIVLAGGKSGKNKQNIPSQFIAVHGKPVIIYSLDEYQRHPSVDDIYVVCLKGWENIVIAYAEQYEISKLRGIITGGRTGMLSLKNCIDQLKSEYNDNDIVIIQEATRPLVYPETISELLQVCMEKGSATICHSMNEYVQFSTGGGYAEYIDRGTTVALQSPEAHKLALVKQVFDNAQKQGHPLEEACFTMLLYNMGCDINFVNCNVNNIKIAKEEDVAAFGSIIKYKF